ncbi:10321_t:CDS:2 [Ambispora gerdemannii]|uniref:10321_t:CDS:1 n=1 Tax=Ambispora gerdemannii TaxID=144530 RepID=A0A9N9A5H5_9GLOM|nr:10321_t:CDS:2 [Ambispora gerdemannii]
MAKKLRSARQGFYSLPSFRVLNVAWFNDNISINIIRNKNVTVSNSNTDDKDEDDTDDKIRKNGILPKESTTRKKIKINDGNSRQPKRPLLRRVDREVNLCCKGKVLCNAVSRLFVYDEKILDIINEQDIGIAQIFRCFEKLPDFQLLLIGRTDTTWWREYSLCIDGMECYIKEIFPKNLFKNEWIDQVDNNPDDFFDKECTRNAVSWDYYSLTFKSEK